MKRALTSFAIATSIATASNAFAAPPPDPPSNPPATDAPQAPAPVPTTKEPALAQPTTTPPPAPPETVKPTDTGVDTPQPGTTPKEAKIEGPALLAPKFSEDRYPAEPSTPGLMPGVPLGGTGMRFAMHGYFRAPLRFTKAARPGTDSYNWRTPYLVDDSYFNSGFAYTPVNESDFSELYLSVGNDHLTATIQFQGSLYSDAARPIIDQQLGISQGYLTYRFSPSFIPLKTNVKVKAGAFWDRFGYIPKYDTYLFGRTHQMGEQIRVEVEHGPFIFWALDGFGAHLEDVASNQGLTLLHTAQVGASWNRTLEASLVYMNAAENDLKPLKEIDTADLGILGFDVRADTHYAGKVYGVLSTLDARNATYESPAIEMMHSYGGRGLTENYFGTQNSNHGTGKMMNIGLQYDASFDDIYRSWTNAPSPLPWNGDINATIFGMYSYVNSDQKSPDPVVNKDGRQYFKYGFDAGYRITEWMGLSFRYDRVVMDTGDSANSFRILSPKLAFYTSLLTRETIFLQYSRYSYNERIRLRQGQVQLETNPDDHAIKLQAQIVF